MVVSILLWWAACDSSPDGVDEPYAACDFELRCANETAWCVGQPNRLIAEAFSCGLPCTDDTQCPEAREGVALPVCAGRATADEDGVCVLTCKTTGDCPDGMVCGDVDTHGPFADRTCGWPRSEL